MRRTLSLLIPGLVALLVTGGSLAGTNMTMSAGGIAPTRLMHFYRLGPSATCNADVCAVGLLGPVFLDFRGAGTSYRATVTLSFQYRTTPRGAFDIELAVKDPSGHRVSFVPPKRALAASVANDSATISFLLNGLHPGVKYELDIAANITKRVGQRTSIKTSAMLLVVEASAA